MLYDYNTLRTRELLMIICNKTITYYSLEWNRKTVIIEIYLFIGME